MTESASTQIQAGGACVSHGVYTGSVCPSCHETRLKAALRQATWEATQRMNYDEIRTFIDGVLREVETDEP